MKKLVVLTGAGISAESGIKTFRDADGLWEGHDVMKVASYDGWLENKALVLDFYNQRRRQLHTVVPNKGHLTLAEMEDHYEVHIITQNVDDLHERAGSTNVLHLHGELLKVRGDSPYPTEVMEWKEDLLEGDCDPQGNQLRPHIVWFGEQVPAMEDAIAITEKADYLVIVGTSMQVYPAAGLLHYAPKRIPVFYIDPKPATLYEVNNSVEIIEKTATEGVPYLKELLVNGF